MEQYRLITRSDMDGLVCAVLLNDLNLLNDIKFVHPKDMQDGIIAVTDKDITTNLPYVEGVHLAFDHHLSETIRNQGKRDNYIIDATAPSAARVVYDYYKDEHTFPAEWDEMMIAVDKADSARFTIEDVLMPKGWELLSFLMDARTGLGRFRSFRISNYALMMDLIDYCKDHKIEDILELPDVKERVDLYHQYEKEFNQMMRENAVLDNNVLIVDLRNCETIYPSNRFTKYALYPNANISVQMMWGKNKQNTVLTVGKSIFDRSSKVNVGELMLSYGGGGHKNAGTCQVENDVAEQVLAEIVSKIKGR